jgi:hypothetical protein
MMTASGREIVHHSTLFSRWIQRSFAVDEITVARLNHREATGAVGVMPADVFFVAMACAI